MIIEGVILIVVRSPSSQNLPRNRHIPRMYDSLLDTTHPIRLLHKRTDAAVVIRQLVLVLFQPAVQFDDVCILQAPSVQSVNTHEKPGLTWKLN